MSNYNIIIQEAIPEMKTETGEVIVQAQQQYTLSMVFPTIYTHYVKANDEVMNLYHIEKCKQLIKVIESGEGDVAEVRKILKSDELDYEHIYQGAIFGEGLNKLIEFANDSYNSSH